MKGETRASIIKNVVNTDQHWEGSDFAFSKQSIFFYSFYKYIQIAKGKYFKALKKDMVFRVNIEKIKLEIEIYKKLKGNYRIKTYNAINKKYSECVQHHVFVNFLLTLSHQTWAHEE